jgi:hypothetical protein
MLVNRTHAEEQYVGEGEGPKRRRSKRSLNDKYYYDSEINIPKRRKRSYSQERFIEIMVVADKKMAEYHGDSLYHYILTLMSIVRLLLLLLLKLLLILPYPNNGECLCGAERTTLYIQHVVFFRQTYSQITIGRGWDMVVVMVALGGRGASVVVL